MTPASEPRGAARVAAADRPRTVRPALLLVFAAGLAPIVAGCGLLPGTPDADDRTPRLGPVAAHPDSLLGRLVPEALDDAFPPDLALAYALDGAPGDRPAANPLALALPPEPSFADPRARDTYVRRRVPTTWPRAAAAEAVQRSGDAPVRRAVVVVDTLTGRVVAAEVWRRSRALLYDEDAHVAVQRHPATGHAARVAVDLFVDTAGAPPRRHSQTWGIGNGE
jgi:hypothetical protein